MVIRRNCIDVTKCTSCNRLTANRGKVCVYCLGGPTRRRPIATDSDSKGIYVMSTVRAELLDNKSGVRRESCGGGYRIMRK